MFLFKVVMGIFVLTAVVLGIPIEKRMADALPQLAPPPVMLGPVGLQSITISTSSIAESTSTTGEPTATIAISEASTTVTPIQLVPPPASLGPIGLKSITVSTSSIAKATSPAIPTSVPSRFPVASSITTTSTTGITTASGSPKSSTAKNSYNNIASSENISVAKLVNKFLALLFKPGDWSSHGSAD